jgi:hypothetical protein
MHSTILPPSHMAALSCSCVTAVLHFLPGSSTYQTVVCAGQPASQPAGSWVYGTSSLPASYLVRHTTATHNGNKQRASPQYKLSDTPAAGSPPAAPGSAAGTKPHSHWHERLGPRRLVLMLCTQLSHRATTR